MKSILAAIAVVLLLGSTAYGQWYVGPRAVYYPASPYYAYPASPYYAYPAPVYADPAPYYAYRMPVVASPYYAYSPVYSPVMPAPVVAVTAWSMLFEFGGIELGQRALQSRYRLRTYGPGQRGSGRARSSCAVGSVRCAHSHGHG